MNDADGKEISRNQIVFETNYGVFCTVVAFEPAEDGTALVVLNPIALEPTQNFLTESQYVVAADAEELAKLRNKLFLNLSILEKVSILAGFTPENMVHVDFNPKKK